MKNSEPSIGYSVAYPFGVIGPILCIYFMTRSVQPKFPPKVQRFHLAEITLADNFTGLTLEELGGDLPGGVQVTMVRKSHQNVVPVGDLMLAAGDGLLVIAEQEEAIAEAARRLGKLEPGRIVKDRSALDYIRVFVAKANLIGVPLAQLPLPSAFPVHLLHVRRYDADLIPAPDLSAPETFWTSIGRSAADFPSLTWKNFFVGNLLPVTIGNIVGGSVMLAAVYWFVYLRKRSN